MRIVHIAFWSVSAPLLCLVLTARSAWAGDCLVEHSELVKRVEDSVRLTSAQEPVDHSSEGDWEKNRPFEELQEAYVCLATYAGCHHGSHNQKWAGRRGAQCIAKAEKFKYRDRLAEACGKIFQRKRKSKRVQERAEYCVRILARTAVGEAGGVDIYEELVTRYPKWATPKALATLGDRRATAYFITKYREAVEIEKTAKKNRWRLKKSLGYRREILNLLWHFKDPKSAAFLEEIAAQGANKELRKTAQDARARIEVPDPAQP